MLHTRARSHGLRVPCWPGDSWAGLHLTGSHTFALLGLAVLLVLAYWIGKVQLSSNQCDAYSRQHSSAQLLYACILQSTCMLHNSGTQFESHPWVSNSFAGLAPLCWPGDPMLDSRRSSHKLQRQLQHQCTDLLTRCCVCCQGALVVLQSLLHLLLSHLPAKATCMPTACKQALQTIGCQARSDRGSMLTHLAYQRRCRMTSGILICIAPRIHCIMKPHLLCRSTANSQGCGRMFSQVHASC